MKKEAIFHRTYSEYSFAEAADLVVIRLRAAKADLESCTLCFGDRMEPKSPISITEAEMTLRFSDAMFDYFEVEIDPGVTRLCYYFRLSSGGEALYYYSDCFHEQPEENRQLYYNFHYIRSEDMDSVPDWWRKAVVYQIFPDSFASSRRRISCESRVEHLPDGQACASKLGGTLRGVTENLDYIASLGFNCIYLTPIFAANSPHKYDTIDYFEIDPCFGSKDDLRRLVSGCHERGMRLVLDGVFNHSGPDFFAFRDLVENGEDSRYRDWYYPKSYPLDVSSLPNYECFAYVGSMPKLNTGNPETARYLIDVGLYWIREFDIDGWRLDVANEINHDFWRAFRREVRALKPDAVLIGEIWDDARSFLDGEQFDSAMNYNLTFAIDDFFAYGRLSAREFMQRVQQLLVRYRRRIQQAQLNLIDSHDVPRFLTKCGGDERRLRLAALFLFTHPGVPMLFYGDERGLSGWHEAEYRQPMDWSGSECPLSDFIQYAIKLRHKYGTAIQYGWRELFSEESTLAYKAELGGHGFTIAMNVSETPRMIYLPEEVGNTTIELNAMSAKVIEY